MQQSLVDTKKKERSLDVKVHEQIKIIDDLKRQIQRGSEINKNLVDKVKQRDQLHETITEERDFYQKEAQKISESLKEAHTQKL